MQSRRYRLIGTSALFVALVTGLWQCQPAAVETASGVPTFTVDPYWPKRLPAPKDSLGVPRQWVPGESGGTCVDSHDHIFTLNRGWQRGRLGRLINHEGSLSIPSPPVVAFDVEGNVVTSWGDMSLEQSGDSLGAAAVMPENFHGCFVDFENNVWITGESDGVAQKYSHDGELLLQIGQKGVCDGPSERAAGYYSVGFYRTCAEPGFNQSQTMLTGPAGLWVDPNPDPVTGEVGSVYIADGYGNFRVVVFDSRGKYLRQWGSPGSGEGQYIARGGGHPHCVAVSMDGFVYSCDRGNHRIHVHDREGKLVRTMPVRYPAEAAELIARPCQIVFSTDEAQTYLFVTELANQAVLTMERATGTIVGTYGSGGHMAGEFTGVHTMSIDSKGNLYVGESGAGRRTQKLVMNR